jgi:Putative DNA-binding domain
MSSYYRAAPQFAHQSSTVNGKRTGSDLNLYKLFLEQAFRLLKSGGECGIVIPSGIYTDLGAKGLREMLFEKTAVTSLIGLSNEKYLFEDVHHAFRFAILTFEKASISDYMPAVFRINPREAISKDKLRGFLQDKSQHVAISVDLVRRLSPESLGIMEFRSELDARIAESMLQFPLLGEQLNGVWNIKLSNEFHMTNDSYLFRTVPELGRLPLFTGKMLHQFSLTGSEPIYWVDEIQGRQALLGKKLDVSQNMNYQHYRWTHRRISNKANERTFISTIIPSGYFTEVNSTVMDTEKSTLNLAETIAFTAISNSFCVDWMLRQRVDATLNMFYVYQLPIPRLTSADPQFFPIVQAAAKLICTTPEFDELAVSAGLRSSIDGVTDEAGRAALRAELDGRVAHLYGLSESEFTHILGTFPLVAQPVKDAALAAYRALKPPEGDPELARLAALGESGTLEYKSSLRSPTKGEATPELRATLEAVIVKEVAAFLNAQGGTLLIGLDDDGKPLGLNADYASFKEAKDRNRDGFERCLKTLLRNALGAATEASLGVSFGLLDGQDICRVEVPAGNEKCYVLVSEKSGQKRHVFYLRSGNRAEELPSGPELDKYTKGRW